MNFSGKLQHSSFIRLTASTEHSFQKIDNFDQGDFDELHTVLTPQGHLRVLFYIVTAHPTHPLGRFQKTPRHPTKSDGNQCVQANSSDAWN